MRRALIGIVIVVVLAVGALLAIPMFVPAEVYKAEIEKAASSALGRKVTVSGPVSVSALPRLEARAKMVAIANPQGFANPNFAEIAEMAAALELLPLIARRVEIKEFVLRDPKISLESLPSGANNWSFGDPEADARPSPSEGFKRKPGAMPLTAALGDVRIINGAVSFHDRKSGAKHELGKLNVKLGLPDMAKPMALGADFTLDGEPMGFNAKLDSLKSFFDGAASPFTLDLRSALGNAKLDGAFAKSEELAFTGALDAEIPSLAKLASFLKIEGAPAGVVERVTAKGTLAADPRGMTLSEAELGAASAVLSLIVKGEAKLAGALSYAGDVTLDVPSVRKLAAAVGASLPAGDTYGPFAVSGRASGGVDAVSFDEAKITFDAIAGTGSLKAALAGARPKITGALALGALDVTPYLPADGGGSDKSGSGTGPWSKDPIDLSPLRLADADLAITAKSLKVNAFSFGESALRAVLDNGKLQIDLERLQAYGGSGTGRVVVDATGAAPSYALKADLAAIQAQPLLQAAARFGAISGAGGAKIDVAGTGRSQADIMSSLAGQGGFDFRDGKIAGVNLGAVVRGLDQALKGDFDAAAFGSEQSTDFSALTGAFQLEGGVAKVADLSLLSPLVRVTGGGALDIGRQSVDLRLEPRAVASAEGQGGKADLSGFAVPVRIQGNWSKVKLGVDQQAVRVEAARLAREKFGAEAAGALDKNLGGDAGAAIKNILGLGGAAPGPAPGASKPEDAKAEEKKAEQKKEEEKKEDDPAKKLLDKIFTPGG